MRRALLAFAMVSTAAVPRAWAQDDSPIVVTPNAPTPPANGSTGDGPIVTDLDEPFVITAPAPTRRPTFARPWQANDNELRQPPAYAPYGPYGPPVAQPPPLDPNWGYRRVGSIAASIGVGSPVGYVGIVAEVHASRNWTAGLGFGSGGTFGPGLAMYFVARPLLFERWAFATGFGFSTNFTPAVSSADYTLLRVPIASFWWNPELGIEYRAPQGFYVRSMLGYAVMLNTGTFTNQFGTAPFGGGMRYGPYDSPAVGFAPVSAADAHDVGRAMHFAFFHVDVGFAFGGPPPPAPATPPATASPTQ